MYVFIFKCSPFLKVLVLNLQSQFIIPIETCGFQRPPKKKQYLQKCGEVIIINCTSIQQSAFLLDFVWV